MKALLLDLDDTLIDERRAIRAAFAALVACHRGLLPDLPVEDHMGRWREATFRQWRRYERGEISFQDQRRERLREFLAAPFSDTAADEAYRPYGETYLASLRLLDDTPEFLARTAGLPRIVVTNGERELQARKLAMFGLDRLLQEMITPMDCGTWKPDPGIFRAAMARLDVEAPQCIMIGDDEERDLEPARRLGMETFRVDADDPERTLLKALEKLRL
ncbi:MAG TPA: HAD family hydrolase [Holophaga sp.]|nr:HAD family hydrolase [Holophaga sp.]